MRENTSSVKTDEEEFENIFPGWGLQILTEVEESIQSAIHYSGKFSFFQAKAGGGIK